MFSNIIAAAVLLAISALLMAHHEWMWRAAQRTQTERRELDFARRQYRRRLQTSGLIGVVAVAIGVSGWIEQTSVALFYWLGIAAVVVWIGLLALGDWASSYSHFQQIHKRHVAEHAALQAELKAELNRRRQQGNGESTTEADVP